MYQRFYGLRELPFELTPNPRYLYLTRQHSEALSNLHYGLSSAKAITLVIGEAGTGKTTLLRAALESELCRNVRGVYLSNPALTRAEFVRILAHKLELGSDAGNSKADLLETLEGVLRERRDRGQITALVVDEAQSLSDELLEELRLLANSETATEKLLPLVLAGQPELRDRLNGPHLVQLKQRVALRCEIGPFTLNETAEYIALRIKTAGGNAPSMFTRDAVVLIHQRSRGIPRTISAVCDNALLAGFALGRRLVDTEIVLEVSRDFDLGCMPGEDDVAVPGATATSVTTLDSPDQAPQVQQEEAGGDDNAAHERELFAVSGSVPRRSRFRDRIVAVKLKP